MDDLFSSIKAMVLAGKVRVSEHGYDELANDGLTARELVAGIAEAKLVELYPDYPKGPCVLLLQLDGLGKPVHVVWGIPKGHSEPVVLVTAYRPEPARWSDNFLKRNS